MLYVYNKNILDIATVVYLSSLVSCLRALKHQGNGRLRPLAPLTETYSAG